MEMSDVSSKNAVDTHKQACIPALPCPLEYSARQYSANQTSHGVRHVIKAYIHGYAITFGIADDQVTVQG